MSDTHLVIGAINSVAWARCGVRDEDTDDKFTSWASEVDCADCLGEDHDWPAFNEAFKKAGRK